MDDTPKNNINGLLEKADPGEYLQHYGTPKHSGRYPWGSGDDPVQRNGDMLSVIEEYKKAGFTESSEDIEKWFGMKTPEYRSKKANCVRDRKIIQAETVRNMSERGVNNCEIAEKTGLTEGAVRYILKNNHDYTVVNSVTNDLKQAVKDKQFVDVGKGVELEVGITRNKFNQSLREMQDEGYVIWTRNVAQLGNPGMYTKVHVLCPPGTAQKEIYGDVSKIKSFKDYTIEDVREGETTRTGFVYPKSMDSKRLLVKFDEDGGSEKDGLIELRRGVKDVSLGDANYSQVRILVDNTKFIKGMAVYKDDLPDGIDVVFNSNKPQSKGKLGALKDIKSDDPANPFGSAIKEEGGQSWYSDNGKKQLSLINKRSDEGDWHEWQDKLPAQFLSKQSKQLMEQQTKQALDAKRQELDEILALEIPTVKKALLEKFADKCDSDAVSLSAAALPRQKYHVILPEPTLSEKEVYAPSYNDGEKVALIRFPHGGTFEIPILTVNNKNKSAKKMIGNGTDAVAINKKVADQLSGADFDGDTVMVIPVNNRSNIKSRPPLKQLEGFDPKREYPKQEGMVYMKDPITKKDKTQREMGMISNLITDMTLKGADDSELARAVRHSMVVIDAAKHELNYKESERNNGILELKRIYQGHYNDKGNFTTGASTLLSSAKSPVSVPKTRGIGKVNKETGEVTFKQADEYYTVGAKDEQGVWRPKLNRQGEPVVKQRMQNSSRMAQAKDANELVSKYRAPAELIYASYANSLKSYANEARKLKMATPLMQRDPSTAVTYRTEVESLKNKLNDARLNAPRERQALVIANSVVNQRITINPELLSNKEDLSKLKNRELFNARSKVGAKRQLIDITDKEWEAISKGAVSDTMFKQMMYNVDDSELKKRATPKQMLTLSPNDVNKIQIMQASGNYTLAQIATAVGKSVSTVSKIISNKD